MKIGSVKTAFRRFMNKKPKPLWFVILSDILAVALCLVVYAYFHHVRPSARSRLGIVSTRGGSVQTATDSVASETGEETDDDAAPAATSEPRVGDFSAKFADKFTDGEIIDTETQYISQNLCINISNNYIEGDSEKKGIRYYVADIYIRDISCFQTAFAKDTYGRNVTENIEETALRHNSIVTLSGDFYGIRHGGVCIRNGELYYNEDVVRDIGVLYWDGTFEWFTKDEFNAEAVMEKGAYQCWNFGPALLDETGVKRAEVDPNYKDIAGNQPRAALGYYEPGHYCFIAVDGRNSESRGMTLTQMAELAQSLGLTQCYNLDGGQTVALYGHSGLINVPATGGRDCSDYLCIVDEVTQ